MNATALTGIRYSLLGNLSRDSRGREVANIEQEAEDKDWQRQASKKTAPAKEHEEGRQHAQEKQRSRQKNLETGSLSPQIAKREKKIEVQPIVEQQ